MGWIGGFLWVTVVGLVFLVQGKIVQGGAGLLVFVVAIWTTHYFAPWHHPTTPYWRLYLGPYLLFLLTIVWAAWGFGAFSESGYEQHPGVKLICPACRAEHSTTTKPRYTRRPRKRTDIEVVRRRQRLQQKLSRDENASRIARVGQPRGLRG